MAETTGIVWTDSTFNPWIGCTKVSPACDHCYAERDWQDRRHVVVWGAGQPRARTGAANWKFPVRWNAKPFYQCAQCGWRGEADPHAEHPGCCAHCGTAAPLMLTRRRVFSASLADWLDNDIPVEWLVDFLDLVRRTPNLDWLLLTKRVGNWRGRLTSARDAVLARSDPPTTETQALLEFLTDWLLGKSPKQVWLGISVCNQAEAERDIPKLLAVPAAVRFLSIEPMLGPLSLRWLPAWPDNAPTRSQKPDSLTTDHLDGLRQIDWVICGGESGPKARPLHPDWVRGLRDQCAEASVPFLFKQWGEHALAYDRDKDDPDWRHCSEWDRKPGRWINLKGGHGFNGARVHYAHKVGTKAAGRLLDGIEHNAFPMGAAA